MFLSKDQLFELTGYELAKCQIRWLRANGIPHFIGGDDKPKVLQSAIESMIGGNIASVTKKKPELNVVGLRELMGNRNASI